MAVSNKNTYILSSIYGISGVPADQDSFRRAIGNYWIKQPVFPDYGDTETLNVLEKSDGPLEVPKVNTLKIIPRSTTSTEENSYPYYETNHTLELFAPQDLFETDNRWVGYIKEIVQTGRTYTDISFDLETPIPYSILKYQNSSAPTTFNRTDFEYNYYALAYETLTNPGTTPENVLPNMYNFLSYKSTSNTEENVDDKIFQALTAGGQVETGLLEGLGVTDPEKTNIDYYEYFDTFGRAQADANLDDVAGYMKNVIFDVDSDTLRKEADKYASAFPMYVNLEFMSDAGNQFTEILKDSKLSKSLISYLSNIPADLGDFGSTEAMSYDIVSQDMQRIFEESYQEVDEQGDINIKKGATIEPRTVRTIDLGKWISEVVAENKEITNEEAIYLQDNPPQRPTSPPERMLYSLIFSGKLKTLVDNVDRDYLDISDGQKSYSETILYKVEKFGQGSEPIQTIWLPNTNEIDLVKYIDTQVKFNTEYTYLTTAYQLVVGSEYEYTSINFPDEYDVQVPPVQVDDPADSEEDDLGPTAGATVVVPESRPGDRIDRSTEESDPVTLSDKDIFRTEYANELFVTAGKKQNVDMRTNFKATIGVRVRPVVKIIEVPFFQERGSIIDDPPVFPDVNIIPYRGVQDRILINLNSSAGSYDLQPVTFNQEEKTIVDAIRVAKKLEPDSKITFTTDDRVAAFEVYRLQTPPQRIEDFANNLINTVITDVDSSTAQKASSASYVDNIQPNIDYYYTFRARDVHGKISNPSQVYRLRLVENSGAVYPLVEIYEMPPIKPQMPSKNCKKLLNISPRLSQTIINQIKSDLGDGTSSKNVKNIILGIEEKPLFGKTFKIRLTSRKTGKQVDFNVNFNVKIENN